MSTLLVRLGAVVMVAVAAIVAVFLYADPEAHPPHVARPTAGVAIGPLPLSVSGADQPGEVITQVASFVEGVVREQERLAEVAAAEAERVEAARRAPSVGGTSGGARPSGSCGSDWDCFRECTIDHESRSAGEYSTNTGNGYYGAFQFAQSTWNAVAVNAGYGEWAGRPASDAPKDVQDAVARFLWEHSGTQPWGGRCG